MSEVVWSSCDKCGRTIVNDELCYHEMTEPEEIDSLKAQLAERDKLLDVEHAKGFREGYLLATKQLRSDLGEANELLERFQDKYVSASAKIVEQELKLDEAVKALKEVQEKLRMSAGNRGWCIDEINEALERIKTKKARE